MKAMMLSVVMFLSASAGWAQVVVGKVDIQKILVTVSEGQAVREKLKKIFDKKNEELQKEEEKIRKSQEGYQKQSLVMNQAAKQQKEQEIGTMIRDLQTKSRSYNEELQEMEQKEKMPILEKLKVVIEEISKKENVDFTIEVSTAPVVYAKSEKDLTEQVVEAYNKKHPKK